MTSSFDERESAPYADVALLRRVQQQNQAQILEKLLHDLRNPAHSMRITVELLSRLSRAGAEASVLMSRATRYVDPAEAALASLSRQIERLSLYLGAPRRPEPKAILTNEWLAEVAALLGGSTRGLAVEINSTLADEACLLADRPRISHALLRWTLGHAGAPAALRARAAEGVEIELTYEPFASDAGSIEPGELHTLIENAGGALIESGEAKMVMLFPPVSGSTQA